MTDKPKDIQTISPDLDLEAIEKIVTQLAEKVKKVVKKNGFSKKLKTKAEEDLK